ncbi:MAG TPA: histidine phosphatase family protein [Rhodospirillaceae bacterium]|nr:histidine phosphatase family protein [Rhodospirillaceae bacterium]HAA91805.1 histidine phosphatase family protein [Rhodospirillaceae bacterium]HAT34433.1 histidine phosphatase family protein [Rhodospirillaceae bacterium]
MTTVVTRWWWIRHAPVVDHDNKIYGQTDLSADVSDEKVFARLAEMLPSEAVLVTSDLQRTTLTAAAIADAGLELPTPIKEPALREQHFGTWQGIRRDQFDKETGRMMHRFWIAPAFERAPKGESFTDVIARVAPAITRLTADHAGRDIICVAHGGTIRAAIALALGLGPEKALAFRSANCGLTRLDHILDEKADGGVWRVVTINHDPSE